MDLTPETVGALLSERLMRAVAESGLVKPADADLACRIMREELKTFIAGPKYADERYLVLTGQAQLAWGSLVVEVLRRISAEKNGPENPAQVSDVAAGAGTTGRNCAMNADPDDSGS